MKEHDELAKELSYRVYLGGETSVAFVEQEGIVYLDMHIEALPVAEMFDKPNNLRRLITLLTEAADRLDLDTK